MNGMDLRKVLEIAIACGCTVRHIRGTGEKSVSHPSWTGSIRVNARRKDAPRSLTSKVRRLAGRK